MCIRDRVVGVPLFFVLRDTAGNSGATLGMMSVMLPMFFLAMYQKNGQPAEKILRYYLQARFIRPKVRPYQTRNYYALLMTVSYTHLDVYKRQGHYRRQPAHAVYPSDGAPPERLDCRPEREKDVYKRQKLPLQEHPFPQRQFFIATACAGSSYQTVLSAGIS